MSSASNGLATAGKPPDRTTGGRFEGPSAWAEGIGINFGRAGLATTLIESRRLMRGSPEKPARAAQERMNFHRVMLAPG